MDIKLLSPLNKLICYSIVWDKDFWDYWSGVNFYVIKLSNSLNYSYNSSKPKSTNKFSNLA